MSLIFSKLASQIPYQVLYVIKKVEKLHRIWSSDNVVWQSLRLSLSWSFILRTTLQESDTRILEFY